MEKLKIDVHSSIECSKCNLCFDREPLLDRLVIRPDVMWLGVSAVDVSMLEDKRPLSSSTATGKIIDRMEQMLGADYVYYRSNRVKGLPLDDRGKIRKPVAHESLMCLGHLFRELRIVRPKVVVLLGSIDLRNDGYLLWNLSSALCVYSEGAKFLSIKHPSYMNVYKRKMLDSYIEETVKQIKMLL